jgi:threonine dehydrogenase-like Zn-dependent dehydrogenase
MTVPRFLGGGKIDFVEKPIPTPGPGELLIEVKANALCGSELGQYRNGTPVTPGHVAAGFGPAAGPATNTAVGTPGVIYLMDFCGQCRSCRLGLTNQCLNKRADMGFSQDGGYGPYELIHESIFFPTPPELPLAEATLLLDVLGTTSHALRRAQMVHPDPLLSVAVSGAGPIGLGVLAAAKIVLGMDTPVLVADLVPYRLALVEQLGGIPVPIQSMSLQDALQVHGLQRVDLAVDTSGKTAGRRGAFEVLGQRGVLVCVGHGEALNLTVSPDLIAAERSILGSEYFTFGELPGILAMLLAHYEYVKPIITHCFGVTDIQTAFELFFGGNTGKVVIEQ